MAINGYRHFLIKGGTKPGTFKTVHDFRSLEANLTIIGV
jgi:hypothetical protein